MQAAFGCAAMVKLNVHGAHKEFAASQKLWLRWVEANCSFEVSPYLKAQGAGYGSAMAICKYEHYSNHLKQMRAVMKESAEIKASQ